MGHYNFMTFVYGLGFRVKGLGHYNSITFVYAFCNAPSRFYIVLEENSLSGPAPVET